MNAAATAPKSPFRVQVTSVTLNPAFPHNGTFQQKLNATKGRRIHPDIITKTDHFFGTEDEARDFAAPITAARIAAGHTGPSARVAKLSASGKTYQAI